MAQRFNQTQTKLQDLETKSSYFSWRFPRTENKIKPKVEELENKTKLTLAQILSKTHFITHCLTSCNFKHKSQTKFSHSHFVERFKYTNQTLKNRKNLTFRRSWNPLSETRLLRISTIRLSISTATTFLAASRSLRVRFPVPGPISRTVS